MPYPIRRRSVICALGGAMLAGGLRPARAEGTLGVVTYPTAEPIYQSQFVAATKGFFKDAGLDVRMVQGGSGVKSRELLAARQADISIGDMTHPMQLVNHGRHARVVLPVDTRNIGVVFIIRKDLHDQGIDSLEKLAGWKRPDGRKPLLGVSSLGGTNHVWGTYYLELLKLDTAFTWLGAGDVETMLGSLKTRQIDVLVNAPNLARDAVDHGWGAILFNGSDAATWTRYIGGKVPATAHYTLAETIEADTPKMQAYVTALWRATEWIKPRSPEEILDAIDPFLGSTGRESNLFGIGVMKDVTDFSGVIDQASYDRGSKVWFREMTGIRPIAMADIIDASLADAARKASPA